LLTQEFLEAVEDEIEADLVFIAVVVAGLENASASLARCGYSIAGICSRKAFTSSEVSSGVRTRDFVPAV
jgi:hypothetical protein